jgi:hypothetical protein
MKGLYFQSLTPSPSEILQELLDVIYSHRPWARLATSSRSVAEIGALAIPHRLQGFRGLDLQHSDVMFDTFVLIEFGRFGRRKLLGAILFQEFTNPFLHPCGWFEIDDRFR